MQVVSPIWTTLMNASWLMFDIRLEKLLTMPDEIYNFNWSVNEAIKSARAQF